MQGDRLAPHYNNLLDNHSTMAPDGSSDILDHLVEGFSRLMASEGIPIEPMEGEEMSAALMQQLLFVFSAGTGNLDTVSTMIAAGVDVNKEVQTAVFQGATALEASIEGARHEVIRKLLGAGADIHSESVQGRTPLILAASVEHAKPEVVRMLLHAGAEIDAVSSYGKTALTWAAASANWEIVEVLLKAGADPNAGSLPNDSTTGSSTSRKCYPNPRDALSYAAKEGNIEIIQLLLEAGAKVNPEYEEGGPSALNAPNALYYAASYNKIKAVDLLLKAGSSVDVLDIFGETSLTVAAMHGSIGIMRLLIAANADVNKSCGKGATPLAAASESRMTAKNWAEMVSVLLATEATFGSDRAAGGRAVRRAAGNGKMEILFLLESTGVYSDHFNFYWGPSALCSASSNGRSEAVQFLIGKGVNVHGGGNFRTTAVMQAGNQEVLDILVEAGATISPDRESKARALHLAIINDNVALARFVLDAAAAAAADGADGVDINEQVPNNIFAGPLRPLLALAATNKAQRVLPLLIEAGSTLEFGDHEGYTALLRAAEANKTHAVGVLVGAGANVNVAGNDAYTPLKYAVRHANREMVLSLLGAGAEMTLQAQGFLRLIAAVLSILPARFPAGLRQDILDFVFEQYDGRVLEDTPLHDVLEGSHPERCRMQ